MVGQLPEGTVTILFTDVVGSTALAATAGDRLAREQLRARDELTRERVAHHRGQVVKSTGDGLLAAFASARRAVECAIDIQRAVERLNLARPHEAARLRIGLHSGEVSPDRGDLQGSTVNAAARIESAAGGGEVLVSATVRMLLEPGSGIRFIDRGEFDLKGFDTPWRLFEVAWREPVSAAVPSGRSPLVDRESERAILRRALDAALAGRGELVLLGGEPGVGKSRLAEETIAEAEARGFLALTGHCYETEGTPPYNAFVEILESAAHALDEEAFAEVLGADAAQAAKLVPRLQSLFPVAAPAAERPPALERQLLLDAIRAIIERLGARQPLVLLFEDLHWADASTVVLFQHIARRVSQLPVLTIATYRDTEVFVDRPLTAALPELTRQPRAVDLGVRRLPTPAIADMLRAYGGQEAPRRVIDLIVRETEGNPFFIEQVLKHLTETGRVFDSDGRWRPDVELREDEVPRGVQLVIGRRLERVSANCRRVLTRAAIIGRAFSYELLRELADVTDEETLLGAMDEAEAAQLVVPEIVGGEPRLVFAHELIRQTLLGDLSQPRRQRLHARAADAIEAAAGAQVERHAADLAHHLRQAGPAADIERALRYSAIAGKQALSAAAFEDAERWFDTALGLVGDDARARAELLYRRGVARFAMGRWDLAEPDWAAALDAAESSGAAELGAQIAIDFGMQLAYSRRPAEAYDVGQRAAAALAGQASGVHARLLGFLAMIASDLHVDFARSIERFAEAERLAEAAGDRAALGLVLGQRAHLYWRNMLMVDCAAEYARASEVLDSAGELYTLAQARTWHALALVALGRFDEAAAQLAGLEEACRRVGNPGALFAARRARGFMDVSMTGNLERFSAFAAADLAFLEALGSGYTANSYALVALGRFWEGRWDEALAHARQAVERALDDSWAGFETAVLLLVHAYRGDRDAARALLARERHRLPVAGRVNESGTWELLPAAVETLALCGDDAQAAALYPAALQAVEAGALIRYAVKSLPATTAGIAAACAAQWGRAEEHFRTALRQAQELPNRIDQPEARRWFAQMLMKRGAPGDREQARALLSEAIALYDEIGMPRHRELAATMLEVVG